MLWRFILALGSEQLMNTKAALSWEETAHLPYMCPNEAVDFASRAAEAILEYAVLHARNEGRPLLETGQVFDAAFAARAIGRRAGSGGRDVDITAGPEEMRLDELGIAIRVGRDAIMHALAQFGQLNRVAG